ncbi:hypothetical protein BC939DRAFT_394598, partial [Gamsiella multidivaricata]|uniref:uncharacterized protein n=1 Tax=Gamsiella multidivaricata TaxID=101098 RepID=UPI00221FD20D
MSEKHEIEQQPSSSFVAGRTEEKTTGNVEIEEQVHHEHVEEISPELEALLQTDPLTGLTDDEVERRRETFGRNELIEKKRHPLFKFLSYFTADWPDFGIILALLIINATIGFVEEAKAESALDALKQTLALKTRCWRNGHLVELDTADLVPGDVIVLRLGDIIPADGRLLGIGATGEATEGDL